MAPIFAISPNPYALFSCSQAIFVLTTDGKPIHIIGLSMRSVQALYQASTVVTRATCRRKNLMHFTRASNVGFLVARL